MSSRYGRSEHLHARARQSIPLGTQTFSKSTTQFPLGISPLFAARAQGSHLWDVDGHEYIDFISALNAITLGYNDPDVTAAVTRQLQSGTIFSLAHEIEITVAEAIIDMVPCAEMVRFGKNGSDATAGAIRLARAYTGRDHVVVCGYHGWQDWYIGSTSRNRGVPRATQGLTHKFIYNDLASLERVLSLHGGNIAAVILEPMNATEPDAGFLEGVVARAHQAGALVIFDETITGFRLAPGGAQELFGVIPDLATFGKGLANGYPLSAVAGRAEVMGLMEEIFFSFTMGGEALSLAAAAAVLDKIAHEPVIETLREKGQRLNAGVAARIETHGLSKVVNITGHPSWTFLHFTGTDRVTPFEFKTLFLQEVFARGVLTLGTHNLSYAHDTNDVDALLAVYDEVFPMLRRAVDAHAVAPLLNGPTLQPLFAVR